VLIQFTIDYGIEKLIGKYRGK